MGASSAPIVNVEAGDAPLIGGSNKVLRWLMVAVWVLLLCQQVADIARFHGGWGLAFLRVVPLWLFVWCWYRDSMIGLIWFELVLLFYFISAVEAAFAYHGDLLSLMGLGLVVSLFTLCLAYIRYRGRERRLGVANQQ